MSDTKKVMIYSLHLNGHGQIYCANLIEYFLQKGCAVYLATAGFRGCSWSKVMENPYLSEYFSNQDVKVINIAPIYDQRNVTGQLRVVRDLQIKYSTDYTIFAWADNLLRGYTKLVFPWSKRLRGENYAIFLKLSNYSMYLMYWKPIGHFEGGPVYQIFRRLKRYIGNIKFNVEIAFFLHLILKYFKLLDGSYFLDEYFVKKMKCQKFHHLPDPFKPFIDIREQNSETEFLHIKKNYSEFLKFHKDKDVILCFGQEQDRHGVDYLLRLVDQHPDLVYVHLGETNGIIEDREEIMILKNKLLQQQRIFEIDRWIPDQEIVDLFFESIKYLLLPYKNQYGSSGIMLEGLSHDKPVLVPDIGLMGARVTDQQLGRTYKHLSYRSFCEQFHILRTEYQIYRTKMKEYYDRNFSQDGIIKALDKMGV